MEQTRELNKEYEIKGDTYIEVDTDERIML